MLGFVWSIDCPHSSDFWTEVDYEINPMCSTCGAAAYIYCETRPRRVVHERKDNDDIEAEIQQKLDGYLFIHSDSGFASDTKYRRII